MTIELAKSLPDFASMTDKEVWEWNDSPADANNWSDRDHEAMWAQEDEIMKRAKAAGLSRTEFIDTQTNKS